MLLRSRPGGSRGAWEEQLRSGFRIGSEPVAGGRAGPRTKRGWLQPIGRERATRTWQICWPRCWQTTSAPASRYRRHDRIQPGVRSSCITPPGRDDCARASTGPGAGSRSGARAKPGSGSGAGSGAAAGSRSGSRSGLDEGQGGAPFDLAIFLKQILATPDNHTVADSLIETNDDGRQQISSREPGSISSGARRAGSLLTGLIAKNSDEEWARKYRGDL